MSVSTSVPHGLEKAAEARGLPVPGHLWGAGAGLLGALALPAHLSAPATGGRSTVKLVSAGMQGKVAETFPGNAQKFISQLVERSFLFFKL